MQFPMIWSVVNLAIFILILHACRVRTSLKAVAALVYCIPSSFTFLHLVGAIDHHYLEHTFFQLALLTGLLWFKAERYRKHYATLFGATLGAGHLIHNGLFIVQLPLLGSLFFGWILNQNIKNTAIKDKSLYWVASALVMTVIVIALPSYHVKHFHFDYFYFSWFHIYIAVSTSIFLIFFTKRHFSTANLLILFGLVILLILPILANIQTGFRFLYSEMENLSNMIETMSILGLGSSERLSFFTVINFYTGFILLTPIILYSSIKQIAVVHKHNQRNDKTYLAIFTLFGLFLMLTQFRYHYVGYFLLIVATFTWLNELPKQCEERFNQYPIIKLLTKNSTITILSLLLISPSINMKYIFNQKGLSLNLQTTYPIFSQFAGICKTRPGIVLADPNDGHLIRYFTDCAVISNNFIQTPLHEQKIQYTDRLFSMSIENVLNELTQDPQASGILYLYTNRLLYPNRPEPKLVTSAFDLKNTPDSKVKILSELSIPWEKSSYKAVARLIKLQ